MRIYEGMKYNECHCISACVLQLAEIAIQQSPKVRMGKVWKGNTKDVIAISNYV